MHTHCLITFFFIDGPKYFPILSPFVSTVIDLWPNDEIEEDRHNNYSKKVHLRILSDRILLNNELYFNNYFYGLIDR